MGTTSRWIHHDPSACPPHREDRRRRSRSAGTVLGPSVAVVLAAVLIALSPALVDRAAAATPSRCAVCKIDAARRFLGAGRVLSCREEIPSQAGGRLLRAIRSCEQRYDCVASDQSDAVLSSLRQAVEAIEASACERRCTGERCAGLTIEPGVVDGPVGLAPPAVDQAGAASFDEVDEFCTLHPDYDAPPPLLALPAVAELPEWCSERDAYARIVQACGPPRVVVVAQGAAASSADGSIDKPFASISDAIGGCRGACHILVGPGTYVESLRVADCTFIEGGVAIGDGAAVQGASRPTIKGNVSAQGDAIVLARIDVEHEYGALNTDGDVLVSDAVLRGGYEGGSSAWSATGPRICRSSIAGGYGGFGISWQSTRLWLAGSAVSACYEGMALGWGSRGLKVIDSVVYGGYDAVGTSWGSVDVEVRGSRLASPYAAVGVHIAPDQNDVLPTTFDVTVTGNSIASGTLPESDPALNIVVEDNVIE